MPAFGTLAVQSMLEDMRDICNQCLVKVRTFQCHELQPLIFLLQWERFGPEAIIEPAIDFTKIAFDTIALCSMSYRYASHILYPFNDPHHYSQSQLILY